MTHVALLGFFTRPDAGALGWSVLLLLVTLGLLVYAGIWTRPPRLAASGQSAELGAESPAVSSLLTNGFVVTPPAAVATLLDLVARGWLRIEHTEHEVVVLTDRRGREGDALAGYEQQVLNHVHRLTAGTLTGVSGAGVEIAGLRLPRRWWRRFTKSVVRDARKQGLSKRRWNALALAPPIITLVLSGLLWWRSVRSGEAEAVADSLPSRAVAVAIAVAILLVARRLFKRVRSRAQRPTQHRHVRAQHWLDVRAWMEPRGFEGASAGAANSSSRALAYAAALGLAERAADELPIVPEDDRLAWSNATGEWHVVRVRYPFRPGYGRHPALMLLIGLGVGAGIVALQQYLLKIARGDALLGIIDDFPDQADLIQDTALVLAAIVIVPMIWMAWLAIAGAFDLFSTVERQGVVVRARRPQRVVPFPRLLRPLARRDRFALFIAVDDGRSDRVSAWLSNERTAVPQGARARVKATPVLGYVRKSEPIGTTRPTPA
ncbi:MAG: hypothetical protein ABW195_18570 [Ilumatobacteraceae bacterium]